MQKTVGLALSLAIAALTTSDLHAVGEYLPYPSASVRSRCTIRTIQGSFTGGQFQYNADGQCTIYEDRNRQGSTFGNEVEVDAIKWQAVAKYDPAHKLAEENIALLRLQRPDRPNYVTIGTFQATMKCGLDPWLNVVTNCINQSYGKSPSLNDLALDGLYAAGGHIPRTAAISSQQRAALNASYQASLARQNSQLKPSYSAAEILQQRKTTAEYDIKVSIGAPVLVEPQSGATLTPGQIRVRANRPIGPPATAAFVEFTWAETPAGSLPYKNFWSGPMAQLVSGINVRGDITGDRPGWWKVRARFTAPQDGPWSAEIPFMLSLKRPHSPPVVDKSGVLMPK